MAPISYDDALARNLALIEQVCKKRADENSRFIDDLELDSVDLVGLISEMEDEFGVIVPEDKLHSLRTVGDATRCICELARENVA
jgi:acyl carrier protein